ncbi:uncharacterized protein TEOVI_000056500 [Trypanosoma equiperdum]|uniref:Uncharacterized protein n=1 Tax=Trypanosoma equiperdum TaxID=5694 RepID=A0A1G4IA68_TRYEQ|nr:hypothetical protein, conserved [Trypanosoma equiperdum]
MTFVDSVSLIPSLWCSAGVRRICHVHRTSCQEQFINRPACTSARLVSGHFGIEHNEMTGKGDSPPRTCRTRGADTVTQLLRHKGGGEVAVADMSILTGGRAHCALRKSLRTHTSCAQVEGGDNFGREVCRLAPQWHTEILWVKSTGTGGSAEGT